MFCKALPRPHTSPPRAHHRSNLVVVLAARIKHRTQRMYAAPHAPEGVRGTARLNAVRERHHLDAVALERSRDEAQRCAWPWSRSMRNETTAEEIARRPIVSAISDMNIVGRETLQHTPFAFLSLYIQRAGYESMNTSRDHGRHARLLAARGNLCSRKKVRERILPRERGRDNEAETMSKQ